MGLERAHAQLFGQGEGLLVVGGGLVDVRGSAMRGNVAEDVAKMGLEVVSFTIKEVRDKNEYITNMGRPDIARIKRDAPPLAGIVHAAMVLDDSMVANLEGEKLRRVLRPKVQGAENLDRLSRA